jgi:hypothetical protein
LYLLGEEGAEEQKDSVGDNGGGHESDLDEAPEVEFIVVK